LSRWIITNTNDDWAWYFGPKTISTLEKEFGNLYLQLKEQYLKVDLPSEEERYFQITAYYSPLPNQKKYQTGTYSWDIRLNWDGNVTASWNGMFPWLLAAPRNYAFWTKIYLEWIWVWEVGDRWGAIVNSWERWHEYDRLDIWTGYWDEWLARALAWGRRDIKWFIVDDDYEINIEFDESPVAKYANLTIDADNPNEESVKKLQTLFSELWLYSWEIDGDFVKIKDILINYQVENWVIASPTVSTAWYFGPKTYTTLQKNYWKSSGLFIEKSLVKAEKDTSIDITYSDALTVTQRQNMNTIKFELEKILNNMYKWDSAKITAFKTQFKVVLTDIANSKKYSNKKGEFLYLVEIL
jgi:hypothetical protein